ncbi:NAD(P)/FAD-dependent oxidoreductase [Salinibacterium sp. SWN248]|uniref:dihydrolipoyl dehydrogenase family protein n=1 Tax=Salinibacterium sp. SWN248 TaxID=2792056 RepID=UPI0018CDDE98|nr:FAD-dependent oxidoreductase [Salinibacterium sp. SWN248]MBH0022873.1 FAD-dependent oxidoreductase [Salinibacterium sp. SWN248]
MPAQWDLIVIGSGSAGIVASKTAARFGARVLLVERHRLGGDCLWTGCVPSKSLIAAAHAAHVARTSERFGVIAENVTVDFARAMGHVQDAVATIEPHDSVEAFAEFGIEVAHGDARFTGRHSLEIDGTRHTFVQAVIATGTVPRVPSFPGADSVQILTSDTIWELDELPQRLVVLGGGAIGSELGQAMARLGSDVTIVNRSSRILPGEEERASAVLHATFERDGITMLHNRSAVEVVSSDGLSGELVLDDGTRVPFDRLLAAIGRTPNLDTLSPETAGVAITDQGYVDVDASLRTTNKHIWSAGDVAGLPKFSHVAGVSGSTAGTNAILGLRRKFNDAVVPRVTFTSPEIAAVGLTAADAVEGKHRVFTGEHSATDRAIAEGDDDGFAQIVVNSGGRVLGGTIVGPRAGESLGELTVAVSAKLSTSTLASATHAYPTFTDALWNAAIADVQFRLKSGVVKSGIQLLARVRRALLGTPRD